MIPESLSRSFWNGHHDHFGIAITIPRNPHSDSAGIHVKLLSTSEERLIPRPAGVPASAFWNATSWFPDGTQLLAEAFDPGGDKSIWVISMLGQSPRELREGVTAMEVSPDGTRIAFGPIGEKGWREIWVMGREGDNPQKVLALGENEWLWAVHWSPDGQRLAYLRGQGNPYPRSIETCDLKGADSPREKVQHACGCGCSLQPVTWPL
jgi:WD40 repeat protein